ncbi:MAG: hypothetical protein ACKOA4_05060 [Haliscomenobacter sp.]
MPFQRLSLKPEELLQALREAAAPLFYLSETDMPVQVHHLQGSAAVARFSGDDLLHRFFPGNESSLKVESAGMERADCPGYVHFFRNYTDKIIQSDPDTFRVRYPEELEQTEKWRVLKDLWMDNTIHQRWFKVHLADGAKKAVFSIGQCLAVEFDPDTNELKTEPGDWFALETGTVET